MEAIDSKMEMLRSLLKQMGGVVIGYVGIVPIDPGQLLGAALGHPAGN